MHRLHPKHLAHLAMVGLLIFSAGVSPVETTRIVSLARAHTAEALVQRQALLPEAEPTVVPSARTTVSTREAAPSPSQTPLPTPVAVIGTPLASPTPVPTPVPATPAPTPPPVAAVPAGMPVAGPIVQYYSIGHPALDIMAPCGAPVVAVWSGTIQYAGWKDNGGGYVVDILFDNGLLGSYNHLSGIAVAGGWVGAGSVLGYVGATGWATGCHLHYAMMLDGVWVDPLAFL